RSALSVTFIIRCSWEVWLCLPSFSGIRVVFPDDFCLNYQQENPKQILKKDKKLTPFAISLYLCC
ncbi:hypothetical protein ACKXGD_18435, partial [Enterococcus lactis]|uniref:hypothetical protein n=1 Tax=Enterococcus lactis TaxID=357441 RepID=UPI0039082025